LFSGFGGLAVLLVGALAVLLRRELRPLRRIEKEIGEIESGNRTELGGGYPRELAGATANINALLHSERERLRRYRNAVGNLAHSLKTPLAVIRNAIALPEVRQIPAVRQLDEQVSRMDDIVRYQLKRAAASAGTVLGTAVRVREVMETLRNTVRKVYFDRDIECELNVHDDCRFNGDQGDLTEIAGNLLDNAFKWCRGRIRLSAANVQVADARHPGLVFTVEDDGPGIAVDHRKQVLERGARLDERVSGQGIGLSVVSELAELYRGQVDIGDSDLGGARVTVRLLG
jgi:two-component system sensor histidine kinase PhoQ